MRPIVVVGHKGYIGRHLMAELNRRGCHWVSGIDADLYGDAKGKTIEQHYPTDEFKDKVVVYLAGFHREPEGVEGNLAWEQAYLGSMVVTPGVIANKCHSLIYTSSMRALTDPGLYGSTKAKAERHLHTKGNVIQFRFGTVWGGAGKERVFRSNTAVNYALTRGKFTGNHWAAFTTHIADAVNAIADQAMCASDCVFSRGNVPADIHNVTDTPHALIAHDLRQLLKGTYRGNCLQSMFHAERRRCMRNVTDYTQEARAEANLFKLHGLEVPSVESDM